MHGDRYSANWVVESFKRPGITYKQNDSDKSVYYLEVEPLFATGKIQLLDHAGLARELRMLERRPRPGGKTIVDHPRGFHDDYSNALAIAAAFAKQATIARGFPIATGVGIGAEIKRTFGYSMFDERRPGERLLPEDDDRPIRWGGHGVTRFWSDDDE